MKRGVDMKRSKVGMVVEILIESFVLVFLQYLLCSMCLSFKSSIVSILAMGTYVYLSTKYLETVKKIVNRKILCYCLLGLCFAIEIVLAAFLGYIKMEVVPLLF